MKGNFDEYHQDYYAPPVKQKTKIDGSPINQEKAGP